MPIVKNALFLFFLSFVFLLPHKGQSANPNQKVTFFKSKNSQFSSGEASLEDLNRNLISSAQSLIKTEDEFFQFGQQKLSKKLLKPTFAQDLSLHSGYADRGRFLVLKETDLKEKASVQSPTITHIAAKSLLLPLKYEKGFIQVSYHGKKGYLDISNCISKFDYAYAIYALHPKTHIKQWYYVKSRIFDQMEIYDHTQISMSAVEGIFTNDRMGIVTDTQDHLPLWSKVILKSEPKNNSTVTEHWNQSLIPGHGLVWWKKPDPQPVEKNKIHLHIDEILKKEVYSISSHPKEPKKSIISIPDGVFITEDGVNWSLINQFKNYRGPVYYYNDNLIFVGSYRSIDHAKTFEQFINVKSISSAIENKLGFLPQSVKIKKINSHSPSKILIDVDTGFKTLQLQSMIYEQNWEVLKNKF